MTATGGKIEGQAGERPRRRGLRSLVEAAKLITESGMVDGLTRPGELVALFLVYEAKGRPYGQVLVDYRFGSGRPERKGKAKTQPAGGSSPGPAPATGPARRGVKEPVPLAKDLYGADGLDRRSWREIVETEAFHVNGLIAAEVAEHNLNAIEATSEYRITNHLVTEILASRPSATKRFQDELQGNSVRKKVGECMSELGKFYRDLGWRDFMRDALKTYLAGKEQEARELIDNHVYGDRPSEPEDEAQRPATEAEDESQLAAAGIGDAYEGAA